MRHLTTIWGEFLQNDCILPEYPREQMKRASYINLNGTWDHWVEDQNGSMIVSHKAIHVPFSPEAPLSGSGHQLLPEETLWYRRELPDTIAAPAGQRTLLHFGAVDQSCIVYVNDREVGSHTGGYLPFTIDITDALFNPFRDTDTNRSGPNTLSVRVRDLSDTSYHARGKQKLQSGGMYYTATSGIWQSVWAEIVPDRYIENLIIVPDIDKECVYITVKTAPAASSSTTVTVSLHTENPADSESQAPGDVSGSVNNTLCIPVPNPRLWAPDDPYLYRFTVTYGEDTVESYFAMRSVSIEKDSTDIPRICLNHNPIFLRGVLDQGYWPDGMYTPPSDEAICFDLTEMKKTGFNMVRKHAKIESDRWYYHCDRLGLLVWQDIVNGGETYDDRYVTILPNFRNWHRKSYRTYDESKTGRLSQAGKEEFRQEIIDTVAVLGNHPSLIVWTLFNEGWGQFDTAACTELLRQADPDSTRPIDSSSGWFDQHCGDFRSVHNYFLPFRIYREPERAFILSEFGGLPMLVRGHSCCEKLYGYGKKFRSRKELTAAYHKLKKQAEKGIPDGLCATVYTQWTDIEDEVNGIYTWDRKIRKIDLDADF